MTQHTPPQCVHLPSTGTQKTGPAHDLRDSSTGSLIAMRNITVADAVVIATAHNSLAAAVALAYVDERITAPTPPRRTTAARKLQC